MPPILAHGALGPYDELIFLGVAVAFLGMMGISWLRSQQIEDAEFDPRQSDGEHFELE
ncbi:MAG: hypothetical protein OXE95_08960 [Chloroflexi bacterium]|nr:hypothetical protein [Chloroflexota bacterium]MCY4247685.1 hypothetical protein [Chloroflexota bacterium]